jgi:hypothetical protein
VIVCITQTCLEIGTECLGRQRKNWKQLGVANVKEVCFFDLPHNSALLTPVLELKLVGGNG